MTDTSTLDARAEQSRERIMRALAAVVAEQGVGGYSVQEVADRAGVSHRTVYRHYENREALLDGYARWLDEQLVARGGVTAPVGVDEMPEAVERTYGLFDELGPLVEAFVVVALGTRTPVARRHERTAEFRGALETAGLLTDLSDDDAEAVAALVRTLASSTSWFLFRHEHRLDGARAGRIVAWALQVVMDELRAGRGPGSHREEDAT